MKYLFQLLQVWSSYITMFVLIYLVIFWSFEQAYKGACPKQQKAQDYETPVSETLCQNI
jgi:hypothetical protein